MLDRVAPYARSEQMPAAATAPHPSFRSPRAAVHAPPSAARTSSTNGTAGERSVTGGSASQRPSAASPTETQPTYLAVASERIAPWTAGESALILRPLLLAVQARRPACGGASFGIAKSRGRTGRRRRTAARGPG